MKTGLIFPELYQPIKLTDKFKKSLDEQWCMRFKTIHPDGDNYDGVVTHIKSDFVILREESAFEFDGITILPKRVIKGWRDGRFDACCNQILRQNGSLKKAKAPRWLDKCQTISDVLTAMMQRQIWPGIETLYDEGQKSAFYLGPITSVDDNSVFLRCYDAAGKWEKEYYLTFEEIFRIEFDSQYCNHFNQYMRNKESAAKL